MQLMQEGNYIDALPLLKDARQLSSQNSEIGLLLAEAQIALNRSEEAEAVLKTIPLQDQDTRYQGWLRRSNCLNRRRIRRKFSNFSSKSRRIRRMRLWQRNWRCSCTSRT